MKKILLVFLMTIMMFASTSCAKTEETANEELYTVVIKNDSGATVLDVGVKNETNGNIASIDKLENGAEATISMRASKDAATGAPDLAVVYRFENGDYVESVIVSSETTSEFVITR